MKNQQPKPVGDIPADLSQKTHRQIIGYLGLFLPGLLYLTAGLFPADDLPRWGLLKSVSAYYYTMGI